MSETIEIDGEVLDLLKSEAEAFVDTPNSVLRRLLGLDSDAEAQEIRQSSTKAKEPRRSRRRRRKRVPAGSLLPLLEYAMPILQVLQKHEGRAAKRDVVNEVGQMLDGRLTDLDRENIDSGGERWRNRTQFARLRLVHGGYMKEDSPRGVWEISDEGIERLSRAEADGELPGVLF